jgi:hypothetical protein
MTISEVIFAPTVAESGPSGIVVDGAVGTPSDVELAMRGLEVPLTPRCPKVTVPDDVLHAAATKIIATSTLRTLAISSDTEQR